MPGEGGGRNGAGGGGERGKMGGGRKNPWRNRILCLFGAR